MEGGLGSTRMGSRSSTRHGPASVFQGRVRRWKKSWAPVAPSPTPSAATCHVLLYKWTPVAVLTNGTKESTPEEPPPAKPLRFLPVSVVVLQQRKEEAQKAAEEAEALARLEEEAEAATNSTVLETGEAQTKDAQQDINMGGAQPEETGVNATESKDQGIEGDAQTTRAELGASLQDESTTVAPQEPEAASMDVDQSKG